MESLCLFQILLVREARMRSQPAQQKYSVLSLRAFTLSPPPVPYVPLPLSHSIDSSCLTKAKGDISQNHQYCLLYICQKPTICGSASDLGRRGVRANGLQAHGVQKGFLINPKELSIAEGCISRKDGAFSAGPVNLLSFLQGRNADISSRRGYPQPVSSPASQPPRGSPGLSHQ